MIKHPDGFEADGVTPHFRFELTQEEHDNGYALFITGPIGGTIGLGRRRWPTTGKQRVRASRSRTNTSARSRLPSTRRTTPRVGSSTSRCPTSHTRRSPSLLPPQRSRLTK